ncbi:DNA polymerase-3 subunit epsilon [Paracoccus tibetensis]|uniref:DNA polymerase-3 subunit epsilon n=2 Tax=Paracoccus tibetensis TaxID=336292 RepID=A0A1G5G5P4_9RHOB|nr:DNA polymerase-3 subunit epsilon [Paracoccus tibetensis]
MSMFSWLFDRPSPKQTNPRPDASRLAPIPGPALDRPRFDHADRIPTGRFRFIAIDVETACSDAASICQIGIACVDPGDRIETFSMLVNPRMRFDPFNIRLHGIGPDHVEDAPCFTDAIEMLMPLLDPHHLVQHSNFDKQAVTAACHSCGREVPDWRWADSVTIARRAWPELKGNGGHGLANLKKRLKLDFHHHDAGEDARAAAMVVLHAERQLGLPFEDLLKPQPRKTFAAKVILEGDPAGALAGSVMVFTGALQMSRTEAATRAAQAGMCVRAGVTKQTTHLVVGDQDLTLLAGHDKSSKHRKAEEMQASGHSIRIIGESAFRELVADACPDDGKR